VRTPPGGGSSTAGPKERARHPRSTNSPSIKRGTPSREGLYETERWRQRGRKALLGRAASSISSGPGLRGRGTHWGWLQHGVLPDFPSDSSTRCGVGDQVQGCSWCSCKAGFAFRRDSDYSGRGSRKERRAPSSQKNPTELRESLLSGLYFRRHSRIRRSALAGLLNGVHRGGNGLHG